MLVRISSIVLMLHDNLPRRRYVCDGGNHALRVVCDGFNSVKTLAGNGSPGYNDGENSDSCSFAYLGAIEIDCYSWNQFGNVF